MVLRQGCNFRGGWYSARLPRRHISLRHPSEKTPSDDLSSFITDNEQHLAECNTVSSPPCRLLAHLDTSIMARIDGTTLLVGVRPAHSLVRDKLVTTSWTPLRHAGLARSLEGIFLRAFRRVKSWMSPRYATALCTVYLKHHQAFGCRPALHCTFIP
jgi:hypothetical protein